MTINIYTNILTHKLIKKKRGLEQNIPVYMLTNLICFHESNFFRLENCDHRTISFFFLISNFWGSTFMNLSLLRFENSFSSLFFYAYSQSPALSLPVTHTHTHLTIYIHNLILCICLFLPPILQEKSNIVLSLLAH